MCNRLQTLCMELGERGSTQNLGERGATQNLAASSGPLTAVVGGNSTVSLRPKTTRRGRPKKQKRLRSKVEINEAKRRRGRKRSN